MKYASLVLGMDVPVYMFIFLFICKALIKLPLNDFIFILETKIVICIVLSAT